MSKSITLLLSCIALCLVVQAQADSKSNTPLILITQDNHAPVDSVEDLNQLSKVAQELKTIIVDTENLQTLLKELKEVIKAEQIAKEKISSLVIDQEAAQKLENIEFQDVIDVQELKALIETKSHDLLIQVKEKKVRQPRKLVETPQMSIVTKGDTFKPSQLFLNMNSVTLTGLLVTLFLAVILLIAIKCLYDVKTNDQYGRSNLWVGKQS